jgi:hypothetical protein
MRIFQGDDARVVADVLGCLWIVAGEAVHCLADDFKMTLHRGPEYRIGLIILKCFARNGFQDEAAGNTDIIEPFRRLAFHRSAFASG